MSLGRLTSARFILDNHLLYSTVPHREVLDTIEYVLD